LNLVKKIAWSYQAKVGWAIEIQDLIQAGMIGLLEAVHRYEEQERDAFVSYASQRIRGEIIDCIRRHTRISRSIVTNIKKMRASKQLFEQQNQRSPTEQELANILGCSQSDIGKLKNSEAHRFESIEDLQESYNHYLTDESPGPEDTLATKQNQKELHQAIAKLNIKFQRILQLYYVEELNLREISSILNISIGRVSQIKKAAIKMLQIEIIQE
jgi:RNA polymerase sigma factor for flagellar operon FliA